MQENKHRHSWTDLCVDPQGQLSEKHQSNPIQTQPSQRCEGRVTSSVCSVCNMCVSTVQIYGAGNAVLSPFSRVPSWGILNTQCCDPPLKPNSRSPWSQHSCPLPSPGHQLCFPWNLRFAYSRIFLKWAHNAFFSGVFSKHDLGNTYKGCLSSE